MRNLTICGVLLLIIASGCSKSDSRLHGRWQSDASLSMKWNRENAELSDEALGVLSQRIGHLTLEYRPNGKGTLEVAAYKRLDGTNVITVQGYRHDITYKVLDIETNRVYIKLKGPSVDCFNYVNFVSPDIYWVDDMVEGGSPREYFRKVNEQDAK